jgi:hypothetical protein
MSISRRNFVNSSPFLAVLAQIAPQLNAAQAAGPAVSEHEFPHDSYDFWNGFFDSVNPDMQSAGGKAASRGPTDQLPDPGVQTRYLHYSSDQKKLHYASEIGDSDLLDHEGDAAVGIKLSQYRPAVSNGESGSRQVQLRLDTTQVYPFKDLLSPLAWSSIASVIEDKTGFVSLDRLGLKSDQAALGTSKILLTKGMGKLAVNISRAPQTSMFVKALNVIMQGLKTASPLVSLPAISIQALNAFTQTMSYWEDRTRFVMAGNLTSAVATRQALKDPKHESPHIGLVSGDYLMFAQEHAEQLTKELENLDLVQGYLVRKDADPNLPLQTRAQSAVPEVTYFSMRVSVQAAGDSNS